MPGDADPNGRVHSTRNERRDPITERRRNALTDNSILPAMTEVR
jgi:hypothetical protein